ncbi:MAG: DUF4054 domain-containing protein [Zoogloeaceae bacterium]|jgi:hypothetical protein|nr:DUF4054 domain-containing protein [Zoogloeaceae bacterium]
MPPLNLSRLRLLLPEYADADEYPDEYVTAMYDATGDWLKIRSASSYPYVLLTAHLLALNDTAKAGETPSGATTSASVDKVSVSLAAPPVKNGWQHWLSLTARGQQLWAWLKVNAAGGWEVGGLPEREAFRKVGGVFW